MKSCFDEFCKNTVLRDHFVSIIHTDYRVIYFSLYEAEIKSVGLHRAQNLRGYSES